MSLIQTVESDYKSAFKGGDKPVVEVLRVLKGALMNEEIAKRGKTGEREAKLTDDEALAVIKRQVKQLEEARDLFTQGGRADMAVQNEKEIVILKKYLPAQADEASVRAAVQAVIVRMETVGPADFGKVMGAAMKELKGGADGTVVGKMVKEILGGKRKLKDST